MKDNTINLQYFKEINSFNKAYLLGFIAADGAIVQNQKIHTLLIVKNSDILKFYDCYNHCDFYLSRKKDKFTRKIIQVQTISPPSA